MGWPWRLLSAWPLVAVAVAVAVAVGQLVLNRSENAWTEPVSPPASSKAPKVQVPFGFSPLNADNGLLGRNFPVSGPALVSPGH